MIRPARTPHLALLICLLLLAACGGGGAEPPPVPVAAQPSLTPLPATATEAATFTPEASATAAPSATAPATATAVPSATPEPTAAPSVVDFLANPPARAASPGRTTRGKSYPPGAYEFIHDQFSVPAPLGRVPDDFVAALPGVEPGRCPLTGEPAPAGNATQRPINVRLDNSPQGRPQAGLDNADVVWEALAEGGVTRLTATFHCRTPGTVGPIRSARLIDLQLTPMLGAWLVHVGASQPVTDMIWASPFADRDIDEWGGDAAFYRIDPSQAPVGWLTTYSNYNLIQSSSTSRPAQPLPQPLRGWLFSDLPPGGSSGAATSITVPYQPGTSAVVGYRYDSTSGRYGRYQGQGAHLTQGGRQVAPDNVVVLFARMTTTPIVEDSLGSRSLHFALGGQGEALLFRDGQVWEGAWRREGENVLVRVVDAAGNPIPLAIGQTWVQIVPDTMSVTWQ